jgi:hypothetical protein
MSLVIKNQVEVVDAGKFGAHDQLRIRIIGESVGNLELARIEFVVFALVMLHD